MKNCVDERGAQSANEEVDNVEEEICGPVVMRSNVPIAIENLLRQHTDATIFLDV